MSAKKLLQIGLGIMGGILIYHVVTNWSTFDKGFATLMVVVVGVSVLNWVSEGFTGKDILTYIGVN